MGTSAPNPDALFDDVYETLEQAWRKIEEARALISYCVHLINNETEAGRWENTNAHLRKMMYAIMQVLAAWDKSPVGRKIREDAKR